MRVDGATATAAATEEAALALKSAPALVGRLESKPVAGRRAGNRRKAWGRSEVTMSDEHAWLDGESGGGRGEEKDSTDGGEKGREDETRSKERHVGQGYG